MEITRYNEYDNNGNLTKKIIGGQIDESVVSYTYNPLNQLSQYTDSEGTVTNYSYTPEGLRYTKLQNGNETKYYWDRGYISAESIEGRLTAENYIGITGVFARETPNGTDYMLKNGHGDVVSLINGGSDIKAYDYDAYGVEKNPDVNDTNPFRYSGEYQDLCSGLIYLRNRYYDPSIGRFISEDPIRYGANWYVYCSNNPVNLIDPLGLFDYDDRLSPSTEYNIDVKVMQNELAWLGYYSGDIDGYFGQQTLDAVNAYKNAMGLGNTGSDWGVVGKQTWESMGLTYRTKADIDAGVEIATVGLKQYKDFTIPINNALNTTASVAENKGRFDYKWFISIVDHKQPWDIKRPIPWNQTIGANTFPGDGVQVMYNKNLMTPEELGNYTYGYIGAAPGLTFTELHTGSWYAAGFPFGGSAWEHECNDWNSIDKGIRAYK